MLLVLKKLWDQVGLWPVALLGVVGFLFKYGSDQKKQGENQALSKVNTETQKVQDEWNKVDARPKSVDDAIERLRND